MSGFVGILRSGGAPVEPSVLRRMTDAMSYCGPDHRDIRLDGHIGLGHALLGATPQPGDGEHQPCSLDGRTWIAADARVDGRSAGDDSPDAHVILRAYERWGERCVEHLVGDFAFAIWDGAGQRLFCARDHFGIVPFYYAHAGDGIVFGNVLRALRLHPAVSDALNGRAIGDFLLFGMNMDHAATTFADIRALPPAHALTWEQGVTRLRRYWELPEVQREIRFQRPEKHVERFTVLFDQAVGDRLRSHRVATHLTGGMDSTSVAATAHQVLRSRGADFDLRAYTVVFDHLADEEEGRYADLVAARIGVPVKRLVGDDYWTRPPHGNVTWAFPEPGAIPNQSPVYDIGRRASAFARGLLTGLGGDPLFHAGVSWPSGSAQWRDRAGFAWLALRQGRLPRYGVRTALRRRLRGGRVQVSPLPDWIEPEFARRWDLEARWRQVHIEWDGVRDHRAMLHPAWAAIFARAHPGAQGVPVRVLFPFFDLRLAQYVWETPPYPWRQDKRLLRDAMRGRLPESVLRRPKTLLYDPKGRAHTDDPRYRVAVLPEAQRWRLELMSEPAIREYVHVERARALIESPAPKSTLPFVENSFTLAYWLKFGFDTSHRHPTSKETPHAADPAAA